MADLEERAIRRDKRFLFRLVLLLGLGGLAGGFAFAKLTSMDVSGCAGGLVGAPPASDAP